MKNMSCFVCIVTELDARRVILPRLSIFVRLFLGALVSWLPAHMAWANLQFMTRSDAVVWQVEASRLECRLSHLIDGFGKAIFIHEAGEHTRLILQADSPKMKPGKASVSAEPPPWLKRQRSVMGVVTVNQGKESVVVGQRLAQRILARLSEGLNVRFTRKPWYGDSRSIAVTVSSIGFGRSYQEYNSCLQQQLPMSFRKIERTTLNYKNTDEVLSDATIATLDQLIEYCKIDPSIQSFYIDGHTDSQGTRNDNLALSEQRAKLVQTYLIDQGVKPEQIALRWHGERYPVATNQSDKGMAKNRRVTIRLSKDPVEMADTPAKPSPENTMTKPVPASNKPDKPAS